ncbi:MAG: exosome protein [Thermoprotei archaeon]|nr:MAG: exosome protein [Thermoprotei archaeon]
MGAKVRSKLALSLELEAFCHATEDVGKVKQAILNLIPEELRSTYGDLVTSSLLEGYYGNPIVVLRLKVRGKKHASSILLRILRSLSLTDLSELEASLREHMDNSGNLYLRLDKQLAYLGKVKLYWSDDVVRVKAKLTLEARKTVETGGLGSLLEGS